MSPDAIPPHPPLVQYYARREDRQKYVTDLFDRTAAHYEWICRLMSFGSGGLYRRQALLRSGLKAGARVLDVATGTGLVARAAAAVTGSPRSVVGLDPCHGMLVEARKRAPQPLVRSLGEVLPFQNGSFDFVSHGYALRHVADLRATFGEFRRVLKPGGRLLVLEISRPANRWGAAVLRFYLGRLVPLLAAKGTGRREARELMEYYWDTIAACVPPETVVTALRESGFRSAERNVSLSVFSEFVAVK